MARFPSPRSARDFARELVGIVFPSDEHSLRPPAGLERDFFVDQVRFLLTFTVDYGLMLGMGPRLEHNLLLDEFYELMDQTLHARSPNDRVWENLRYHLQLYARAAEPYQPKPDPQSFEGEIRVPRKLPPAIAKEFVRNCRRPFDEALVTFAAKVFEDNLRYVAQLARDTPIQGQII